MDFLQRVFYTAVGAISIFYFFVRASLSHWKKRGILHEKPKFLWGNLKGVGTKRHISSALEEVYINYKGKAPFVGFYAWLSPVIFVLDIELVRRILIVDSMNFEERGLYNNIQCDPLSENLIQLDRDAYRTLYRQIAPCFAQSHLKSMFPTLLKVADSFHRAMAKQYKNNQIFNIHNLVAAYNTDVISSIAFGLQTDTISFPNAEFSCMSRDFMNKVGFLKMYLAWSFPNLARSLHFKMFNEKATNYFINLVHQQLELGNIESRVQQSHMNFLELFGNSKLLDEDDFCKKRITAQCFSWLLAGLEASNTTLTMCLYELSLHLDIQDKARIEIQRIMTKHKDKLTLESLSDMIYLKQILHETLRKHSPYPFLLRNTLEDYEVPNSVFMLQKGNCIIIPISSIHHDPTIYPNPHKFDPARFNPERVSQRNTAEFLPFGAGPRSCIIQEFAEIQMLICLVTLLLQYQITICNQTPIRLEYDARKLIVTPKTKVELRFERLSNC